MLNLRNGIIVFAVCLALSSVFLAYRLGSNTANAKWEGKMAEAEQKIAQLEARQPQITEKIVTEYVERIKYVDRVQTKYKVETIREYINDNTCTLTRGFVDVHNAAAASKEPPAVVPEHDQEVQNKLSEAMAVVAENYTKYHKVRIQLEQLQKWIAEQQANWKPTQ